MGVLVRNMIGTGDLSCCCDGWLKHWEKYSGQEADECCVVDCTNKAEVGGHVKKVLVGDDNPYIIPICPEHNAMEEDYWVEESTIFVTADPICCDN